MRHLIVLVVALTWQTVVTCNAFADLIVNGGFESPAIATGTTTTFFTGGNIGGWSVVGPSVVLHETTYSEPSNLMSSYNSHEGRQALDLTGAFNSGTNSGVSQVVATVSGQSYSLFFNVGRAQGNAILNSAATADLRINAGSRISFTNTDATFGAVNWKAFRFDFTAVGTSTQIEFLNGTVTTNYVGLDNVRLTAVPEPSSLFLLAGSGIAIIWRVRKKY